MISDITSVYTWVDGSLFGYSDLILWLRWLPVLYHRSSASCRWSPIAFQIPVVWNQDFLLSLQISAHRWLIQLPETAAVLQRSVLSVSCRWDPSSVSISTLREMVLGTSVRSATAGKETNQPYVDTSEFTPERCHSPALTAPTELP